MSSLFAYSHIEADYTELFCCLDQTTFWKSCKIIYLISFTNSPLSIAYFPLLSIGGSYIPYAVYLCIVQWFQRHIPLLQWTLIPLWQVLCKLWIWLVRICHPSAKWHRQWDRCRHHTLPVTCVQLAVDDERGTQLTLTGQSCWHQSRWWLLINISRTMHCQPTDLHHLIVSDSSLGFTVCSSPQIIGTLLSEIHTLFLQLHFVK